MPQANEHSISQEQFRDSNKNTFSTKYPVKPKASRPISSKTFSWEACLANQKMKMLNALNRELKGKLERQGRIINCREVKVL